jgi:uncharacterized protein (TIGR00369 family)
VGYFRLADGRSQSSSTIKIEHFLYHASNISGSLHMT